MDEFEFNLFVGIAIHFGGKKPAYWSGTAGMGTTYRAQFDNKWALGGQFGVNAAVNFYNGGLGSLEGDKKIHVDKVLSGSLTLGGGRGGAMPIRPTDIQSGTGMMDRFIGSATGGTSFVLNNSGRNQQVGFVQLRAVNVSFQFYNDVGKFKKLGIADGYDRWWTGGGNLSIGTLDQKYQFTIAMDVFTADTNSNVKPDGTIVKKEEKYKGSYMLDSPINDVTPENALGDNFNAGQLTQEYLDVYRKGNPFSNNRHSFNLNQGRTSIRLNTPFGQFGTNNLGQGNMYPQNSIHKWIDFHLIPSEVRNGWEFSYQQNWRNE